MGDIGTALQQLEQQPMPPVRSRRMDDAAAIAMAGVEQVRAAFEEGQCLVVAPLLHGFEEGVVSRADGDVFAPFELPFLVFFAHDPNDLIEPALGRDRSSRRRGAVGINPRALGGAGGHQHLHGFGLIRQHRIVQGAMLVVFGPVHVDQLGRCRENFPYPGQIAIGSRGAEIGDFIGLAGGHLILPL